MTSRIIYENGCPFIEIDGRKYPPAAFRSFRPKPDNISLMKRCGIKLNQLLVSGLPCTIGNPYSLFGEVWKGDGVYDFSAFDKQFQMFERFSAPDAYFNVMIHLDTPEWWKKAHPDSEPDSYHHITESAVDDEWKKSAADYMKALISYAEEKHGGRIFGYSIAAGLSNEWFDHSLYMPEYDRSNNRLTKIWRDIIGKPDAAVPTIDSMESGNTVLRCPASDEYKYLELASDVTGKLICYFAKEAQTILNHKKLFGLFFGYVNMDFQVYWNTNGYEQVRRCSDIDMLYSPASYGYNRRIDGVSSYQYSVDSIGLNNKLYLHEDDHRTELAQFPLENGAMLTDYYNSFFEWREVFRREMGNTMEKHAAFWWFDFFGGYYSSPEYERELILEHKVFTEMSYGERKNVSETAVFVDPGSFMCMKERSGICTDLVRANIDSLHRCGAPFDYYDLSDIKKLDPGKYKLYIFLNALNMPAETSEYIKNELSDKMKVWLYAPDICDPEDGMIKYERIGRTVGLDVSTYDCNDDIPRVDYKGVKFGFLKHTAPLFKVNDGESLAYYIDGTPAAARKDDNIYISVGRVPWQMWRDIAKDTGVHIWDEDGGGLSVTSQFISHYTTLTTDRVLHVKEDGVYTDIWSGRKYEAKNLILSYSAEKGKTALFIKYRN